MQDSKSKNIVWQHQQVEREHREKLLGQKGCLLWFTGLSGSGKSTLSGLVQEKLYQDGFLTYILDGDNIRHRLNRDLGFSPEDREENIRRVGEVAALMVDAGIIVMTAFISPYQADRDLVRQLCPAGRFIEISVSCSLEECEKRDPKGLYVKARAGEISDFTGVSAPYEAPRLPEIEVMTDKESPVACAEKVIKYLQSKSLLLAKS